MFGMHNATGAVGPVRVGGALWPYKTEGLRCGDQSEGAPPPAEPLYVAGPYLRK